MFETFMKRIMSRMSPKLCISRFRKHVKPVPRHISSATERKFAFTMPAVGLGLAKFELNPNLNRTVKLNRSESEAEKGTVVRKFRNRTRTIPCAASGQRIDTFDQSARTELETYRKQWPQKFCQKHGVSQLIPAQF